MSARWIVALLALTCLALPSASAHASKTTDDGLVRVTWGMLDEPAYAGQKNRLDLIIVENATRAGIGGLTAENVTVTLLYGEEAYDLGAISAYRGAKGASAGAGNYTSANPVFLTRPGIYTLRVAGNVMGSTVDLEIPAAHEYEPMADIMFPDAEADPSEGLAAIQAKVDELAAKVAALEADAKTQSQTPSPTREDKNDAPGFGLAAALAGVAAAVVILRRRA